VTRFDDAFAPIAVATRSGFDESLHHGAGVALAADGSIVAHVGDPRVVVYPRSSLKPMQAHAMVALGLDLPDELLAVACASHAGSPVHLDAVRSILARHGLDETMLQNTPAHALCDHRHQNPPSSLQQNCSGKHAAMLATCVVNGWPTESYLDLEHPLQVAIVSTFGDLGCVVHHVGVDGCGAPTHAVALDELAGAFARLSSTDALVARAMRANPEMVGGPEFEATVWMRAVPGLMAKEGAAGVMAMAMADGRAVAFKIADGSGQARQSVIPQALRVLGVDVDGAAAATRDRMVVPVVGHGREVGRVEPLEWPAWSS
jgi:L-asparaginase II